MTPDTSSAFAAAPLRRYVVVLIAALGTTLAVVLALNLVLGDRGLGNVKSTRAASSWQQTTRGVTYAPPVGNTRPFKVLRLSDRLPEINAMVLGSSALMGITQTMFPPDLRIYNLTVTGNATAAVAGEAQYIERQLPGVRWMLVGLDWSVGMIYLSGGVADVDLSPAAVDRAYADHVVPPRKRIEDALSWPRVANLGVIARAAFKSADPLNNLRHAFFDIGGAEYRCADGSLARDFDVINRGLCRGYRYDGSWTFANDRRLTSALAATLAMAAAAPSSKYTQYLCTSGGAPNPGYLTSLGETARRFAAKGGRMVFLLPPLAPGLEQALRQSPRWKSCLDRTKLELDAWAIQYQVILIDAGASERYGCVPMEFSDEHHAYPECNARILRRFFADVEAGRVRTGLYRPEGA
ncbi:MAG: hypothetical protein ABL891_06170 [Burkholderiales bacterium]